MWNIVTSEGAAKHAELICAYAGHCFTSIIMHNLCVLRTIQYMEHYTMATVAACREIYMYAHTTRLAHFTHNVYHTSCSEKGWWQNDRIPPSALLHDNSGSGRDMYILILTSVTCYDRLLSCCTLGRALAITKS